MLQTSESEAMKDYEKYTVEDLVRDESFRDWVQGRSREESFWPDFLQKYPDKKSDMQQAEHVIRAARPVGEILTEKEIRREVEKFLAKTNSGAEQEATVFNERKQTKSVFWPNLKYAAAAVVLIAAGAAWYFSGNLPLIQKSTASKVAFPHSLVETSNPTSEPLRLRLGDESEVILSPKSRLRYPAQFADSARIVYLTGEASFSVQRQERPFLVVTGDMVTKVLGTQFVVRAFDQENKFSVQVISGKVAVSSTEPNRPSGSRETNGLILTANQAAVFEKNLNHLSKTLVANPLIVVREASDSPPEIRYEETTLPEILTELERSYGIPIQFDASSLQNCRITATLTNETLYEKLDILCKTVSANYEIVDGQIVVSGRGCK